MVQKNIKLCTLALIIGTLSTGCTLVGEGKFTGGGTMNSAGGAEKAVLTFKAEKCDEEVSGQMNFHDRSAIDFEDVGGVKLTADITNVGFCELTMDPDGLGGPDACTCENQYEAHFTYSSTNPAAPGEGTGKACFFDTGEGKGNFHGVVTLLAMDSGPYQTYLNAGTVSGNVQEHSCPSTKNDAEE
ncbi:hypothetical protein [Thalassotalea mangrovi]|uniref:Uncharacterized protein n=1 Tax=Thalassotalea mangrovi TaxID=2572245 RepID=A0A4U1BCS1_9GAMM|nr:hypothetical protein [Thalassotalea mangrovi]TKB47835.1 hypothetical protein E8M12_00045 [Thalassotalea mangrovi]